MFYRLTYSYALETQVQAYTTNKACLFYEISEYKMFLRFFEKYVTVKKTQQQNERINTGPIQAVAHCSTAVLRHNWTWNTHF